MSYILNETLINEQKAIKLAAQEKIAELRKILELFANEERDTQQQLSADIQASITSEQLKIRDADAVLLKHFQEVIQ